MRSSPSKHVELRDARLLALLVRVERQQRDLVADVHRAALDAADAEPAEVRRVVDRRDRASGTAPSASLGGGGTLATIVSNSGVEIRPA